MIKQTKFLIAAGIVALASSCNSGTAGDPAADAAKIDSMANARLEELKLELMARNDSTIMVLARERADSILVAMGNKPTPKPAARPKPKKVGTDKAEEAPKNMNTKPAEPQVTGKKGDQSQGTVTGKKGDQSQGTVTGKKN